MREEKAFIQALAPNVFVCRFAVRYAGMPHWMVEKELDVSGDVKAIIAAAMHKDVAPETPADTEPEGDAPPETGD